PAAARPPFAGPSIRSTTGCVRPGRRSTPRWRSNSWVLPVPMCAKVWHPCGNAVRPGMAWTAEQHQETPMSDTSGFGKFVPGFEFLQNLAGQAAGGVAQGLEKSIPQLPNLGNWVAPTFNVEDLEKRIEELKAVHFWLDQNAKALGATIQALEVQKMTLATLKTMNFSLGDVANALKIKAADTMANFTGTPPAPAPASTQFAGLEVPARTYGMPAPPPEPDDDEEVDEEAEEAEAPPPPASRKSAKRPPARNAAAASTPIGGTIDPVQWWGALSQQFQNIAANAMKDVAKQTTLDTTRKVASGLTEQTVKTTTG